MISSFFPPASFRAAGCTLCVVRFPLNKKTVLQFAVRALAPAALGTIIVVVYLYVLPVSVDQKLAATITQVDQETGEFTAVTDHNLDSPFLGATKEPLTEFRCLRNTCTMQEDMRPKVGDRVEAVVKSKSTPSLNGGAWTVEFMIASAAKL